MHFTTGASEKHQLAIMSNKRQYPFLLKVKGTGYHCIPNESKTFTVDRNNINKIETVEMTEKREWKRKIWMDHAKDGPSLYLAF